MGLALPKSTAALPPPIVRDLGLTDYEPTWRAMQVFTASRTADTPDEIWLLQSTPVYTLGLAGRSEHLHLAADAGEGSVVQPAPHVPALQVASAGARATPAIPIVKIDRGGQVTYHGPGQLIAYLLLDLRRRNLGVRALVRRMEAAVIDLLAEFNVTAEGRPSMPGVYVGGAKIAALGLRVKNGCCYHGLALNVDMDLTPFATIDPCGYPGLAVTQTRDLGIAAGVEELGPRLALRLTAQLGFLPP
jgi:lipoyl(octanoyl) transferase